MNLFNKRGVLLVVIIVLLINSFVVFGQYEGEPLEDYVTSDEPAPGKCCKNRNTHECYKDERGETSLKCVSLKEAEEDFDVYPKDEGCTNIFVDLNCVDSEYKKDKIACVYHKFWYNGVMNEDAICVESCYKHNGFCAYQKDLDIKGWSLVSKGQSYCREIYYLDIGKGPSYCVKCWNNYYEPHCCPKNTYWDSNLNKCVGCECSGEECEDPINKPGYRCNGCTYVDVNHIMKDGKQIYVEKKNKKDCGTNMDEDCCNNNRDDDCDNKIDNYDPDCIEEEIVILKQIEAQDIILVVESTTPLTATFNDEGQSIDVSFSLPNTNYVTIELNLGLSKTVSSFGTGKASIILKATDISGIVTLTISAPGFEDKTITITVLSLCNTVIGCHKIQPENAESVSGFYCPDEESCYQCMGDTEWNSELKKCEITKYDWNNNPGICNKIHENYCYCKKDICYSGDFEGVVDSYSEESENNPDGYCVPSNKYKKDHYCESGKWTTRTAFIATELLNHAQNNNDFVIYCDHYTKTLYKYPEFNEDDFNNFCVLRDNKNNKIGFGTSLNLENENIPIFLSSIFTDMGSIVCSLGSEKFLECDNPGKLYYNGKIKSFIYGINVNPSAGDKFKKFISNPFKWIYNKVKTIFGKSEEFKPSTDFNKFYLNIANKKKINASYDEIKIVASYHNFNTNICEVFENIECNYDSPTKTYYVLSYHPELWEDLTTKIRVQNE